MIATAVILLCVGIVAGVALLPFARRFHIPEAALFIAGGFAIKSAWIGFGLDTGVRADWLSHFVLYGVLPLLVFEAAHSMQPRDLLKVLPGALWLAVPMVLVGVALTSGALSLVGVPLAAALIGGIVLSATDPAAVSALLRKASGFDQLVSLMEGESLLNDATAIVLFTTALGLTAAGAGMLTSASGVDIEGLVTSFMVSLCGGVFVGAVCGGAANWLNRRVKEAGHMTAVCIAVAVASFLIAEHFHASGVVATMVSALVAKPADETRREFAGDLHASFSSLGWVSNALLYLLVGMTIRPNILLAHWDVALVAVLAVFFIRAVLIYGLTLPLLKWVPPKKMPLKHFLVLHLGGLRGAVAIALVLLVPPTVAGYQELTAAVYTVVIVSLSVQSVVVQRALNSK